MNNMFTSHQDAKTTRIRVLQSQVAELIVQRKQVKKDKILKDAYTVSISRVLQAIARLADQIEKEKPTDGNQ